MRKLESIHDEMAQKVMAEEASTALMEMMTDCLLNSGNRVIEELLQKMGRMVLRRASNISSGLGEQEAEVNMRAEGAEPEL